MKSKLLYLMMFALVTISLTGCDDDSTAGATRITYYPELILDGETTLYLDKNTTFTDPGYSAILNGEDVTDQVKVTSNVNTAQSGVYAISYSITNTDGFASSASRTVIVTDPNDPIEGFYDVTPDSYRAYNGAQVAYGSSYEILVISNGDGTYYVDDLLGGWYCQRAGYGVSYAMRGVISIADDGTIALVSSSVAGWGDSANFMADGKSDVTTGCLSWQLNYTTNSMDFYVTMYKR